MKSLVDTIKKEKSAATVVACAQSDRPFLLDVGESRNRFKRFYNVASIVNKHTNNSPEVESIGSRRYDGRQYRYVSLSDVEISNAEFSHTAPIPYPGRKAEYIKRVTEYGSVPYCNKAVFSGMSSVPMPKSRTGFNVKGSHFEMQNHHKSPSGCKACL